MSTLRARAVVWIVVGGWLGAGCGGAPPQSSGQSASAVPGADIATPAAPSDAGAASSPALDPETPEGRLLATSWSGDLDGMLQRRYLRVLVIPDRMNFFFDAAVMRGVTYDAMREFEKFLNAKFKTGTLPIAVVFVPVRRDQIFEALADGRGDIAAAGLGISDERLKIVDFSDPVRDHVSVIPVGGPDAPPMTSLDDLSGKSVYVPTSSVLPGLLEPINAKLRSAGRPPITVQPADENLEPADILEMVNAGLVPFTLSDGVIAAFWAKVFDQLHPYADLPLVETGSMGWAFRRNSPQLKAAVNGFIKDHREGTAFGNTILRQYLGSTKRVKNATATKEFEKFTQMVELFRKYGDQNDLPYLLVAAQAYQESGLDQNVRSQVGAVGVMQVLPSTAAGKPIEVQNVHELENNIKAGTKYLRFLVDQYYAEEPMDRVTKGLFAIASYNAGPARIQQLRRKAKAQGLDPNLWFNQVELVAAKEIGRETVVYVSNIYKYYLAYKMVTEHAAARTDAIKASPQAAAKGR